MRLIHAIFKLDIYTRFGDDYEKTFRRKICSGDLENGMLLGLGQDWDVNNPNSIGDASSYDVGCP